jgi:hypothetical protein
MNTNEQHISKFPRLTCQKKFQPQNRDGVLSFFGACSGRLLAKVFALNKLPTNIIIINKCLTKPYVYMYMYINVGGSIVSGFVRRVITTARKIYYLYGSLFFFNLCSIPQFHPPHSADSGEANKLKHLAIA